MSSKVLAKSNVEAFVSMIAVCMSLAGCNESKAAVSEAREIALDYAGLARAAACSNAQEALSKVKAAAPYDFVKEESRCKIKPKNLGEGEVLPDDYSLPTATGDGCTTLEAKFKREAEQWEKAKNLIVAIECNKEGKPTTELSAAWKLDALGIVPKLIGATMPDDPRSPGLNKCLEVNRAFSKEANEERQKLRCEVLNTEAGVAGMTSTMLLKRLSMTIEEIDETGAKLKPFRVALKEAKTTDDLETAEKRLETETLALIKSRQEALCGNPVPLTPAKELAVAQAAFNACAKKAAKPEEGTSSSGTAALDSLAATERAARRAAYERAEAEEAKAKAEAAEKRSIPIVSESPGLKLLDGASVEVRCPSSESGKMERVTLSLSISNESSEDHSPTRLIMVNGVGAETGEEHAYDTIPAGGKKVVRYRMLSPALCSDPVTLKVRW